MTIDHQPEMRRAVRRSLWLVAGVCFGLALGFLAGLTKPRVRKE